MSGRTSKLIRRYVVFRKMSKKALRQIKREYTRQSESKKATLRKQMKEFCDLQEKFNQHAGVV